MSQGCQARREAKLCLTVHEDIKWPSELAQMTYFTTNPGGIVITPISEFEGDRERDRNTNVGFGIRAERLDL
ncbi:uncharacterized protein N7529_002254 [Penicillium soppii]|uniref:uncharacterized protein n=1 Tax=Penicillium soppii TaxID=69789 RepID=UPI00254751CB|nr:uncharacterized protein N7529_002254 [Penicillium soppii]KAJ5873824.1 hypothetical protein N7529_002254 [Penicillium soppii]